MSHVQIIETSIVAGEDGNVKRSAVYTDFERSKFHFFHLYKWSTILFQMAVVYELIIIPIFWSVIFPGLVNEEEMKRVLPDIN